MTGNGKHTTYQNADDWGMVQMALFYPHEFSMQYFIDTPQTWMIYVS